MYAEGFLHKNLSPVMHKKRLNVLSDFVQSLLTNKKLSVTELGRGCKTDTSERSAIRRSDRFIGNTKLYGELLSIYKVNTELVIGAKKRPRVLVDWTHIPNTNYHSIRAALACEGRALTLYEEIHTEKLLGNRKTEKRFLTTLKKLIPAHCIPIIVTDAGFHNEWFKAVNKIGWDYVGRVRGLKVYYDEHKWFPCKKMMLKATTEAQYVGEFVLCKRTSGLKTNFFLIHDKPKRIKRYKAHKSHGGGRDKKAHRRAALEPWLLVSSLKGKGLIAKQVIKIYRRRMQIEESFRDLKSPRYGFGLRHAYSRCKKRIGVLLLIAMFASLIAWLIGFALEKNKQHYGFQVNSVKSKRVLSLFFLGCCAIRRGIVIRIPVLMEGLVDVEGEDE